MDSRKIKLPNEAWEVVERKASTFGITESEVINWMVFEFSNSTISEREVQRLHKRGAWRKYQAENPKMPKKPSTLKLIHDAWNSGWNSGWLHFQIRKSTNPFKLED